MLAAVEREIVIVIGLEVGALVTAPCCNTLLKRGFHQNWLVKVAFNMSSVSLATAADSEVAASISSALQQVLQSILEEEFGSDGVYIQQQLFKEFKKIDSLCGGDHIFIFIVSSYQSGKRSRSIRRFQRKLEKYSDSMQLLRFQIISTEDAVAESERMHSVLTDRGSVSLCDGVMVHGSSQYEVAMDSMVRAMKRLIEERPSKDTVAAVADSKDCDGTITLETDNCYDVGICYGTSTGNSKQICDEIVSMAPDEYIIYGPTELNQVDLQRLNCLYLIIVVSTTGDGEVPWNGSIFYRKLRMKCHGTENKGFLSGVKYAILGLGDSNYSQFCAAVCCLSGCGVWSECTLCCILGEEH